MEGKRAISVGHLDTECAQSPELLPQPLGHLLTLRVSKPPQGAVGLTLTWALPPAPALKPLMLPCPDRCSTLDADPRAVAGLGAFCDRWSNPHCPSFSSVLLTPGHQAGWKGYMYSHSPFTCAFHCVARIICISTSLSRAQLLLLLLSRFSCVRLCVTP